MGENLLLAIAQLNPVVGDITGNAAKLMEAWRDARGRDAHLVITSELFLTGYVPDDFILKPRLWKILRETVDALARDTATGPAILLGTPWVVDDKLYNAALLLEGGKILCATYKHELPNYGPFDEKRWFRSGPLPMPFLWNGTKLGVMLCEDMWEKDVTKNLCEFGANLLIVMNGSPYQIGKQQKRYDIAKERVLESELSLVYVNQYGGQDEMVYEGASFVLGTDGEVKVQANAWREDLTFVAYTAHNGVFTPAVGKIEIVPNAESSIYNAIVTGLRDYVTKNGFEKVLLGLSGGIDSALVAALAVDALGPQNVRCVMMPSDYTSQESREDAKEIAKALGCKLDTIPIQKAMSVFDEMLVEQFIGCTPDVTEENIQARIRGVLLMALSNKSGAMLLSTGNKSELATGYVTLYGDMCGGYAPLCDLYKTQVYKLAKWRNENKPEGGKGPAGMIFSQRLLDKAPSAELAVGQKDQDTLPPYETLDDILKCLIEQDLGVSEITMMGHDPIIIRRVYTMLDKSEFKRRQGAPGPKISRRHLRKDRRYPITNRFADRWRTQQTD
ncbi:MAG: NAD+ synthase [Alphaproteobacteria bacterium]|jgi:NAD+ synthase|nr:NAD+ synthase [Alphaproteobacteria bacterium]